MTPSRPGRMTGALALVVVLTASAAAVALPAGAGSRFTDTGNSVHRADIEYMAAQGITRGCNPPRNDRFCPERNLTRGEMAALLARSLGVGPHASGRFADTAGSVFAAEIDALAAAGIVAGCNPPANDRFCPNRTITRGEVAALLRRGLNLPSAPGNFVDTGGSVFRNDIGAISRVGLSRGCNPPANDRYCPDAPVTRGQMATLLRGALAIVRTGTTTTTTPGTTPESCDLALPRGPANPTGVRVKPGQSIQAAVDKHGAGTTFVIEKGIHRNQTVSPKTNQKFVGERGAVMDGGGSTVYAFGGSGNGVLVEGLEIRNYNSKVGEGVVRSVGGGHNWTIRANEIHNNNGAGIRVVEGWKVIGNHLHHNQQYGVSGSGSGILIEGNEISYNNHRKTIDPFSKAGGTKFLNTKGLVIRDNCAHNNHGPGLWTDGDNIDVLYEGNVVVDNHHAGIKHEVSCRATIRNNLATGNGFGNPYWVAGAGILVLNSHDVTVTSNVVRGNNGGIGGVQAERSKNQGSNCIWRLQNLQVSGNNIVMTNGENGIATNGGNDVYNSWNNRFRDNSYELKPQNGRFFRWEKSGLTHSEWVSRGQG